jgi:amidase
MGSYDAAPAHWETLVARKQTEVLSRLPTNWKLPVKTLEGLNSPITIFKERPQFLDGIFSADDIDITENYSAVALLEKMAQGHLTSTEVTTAFCKRAAVAQQLVEGFNSGLLLIVLTVSDILSNRNVVR